MQTTIMAITIDGGVMLAADSRTSRGSFVSNRGAAKLTQLTKNIGVCRSGAAADTQAVAAMMQYYLSHQQIQYGDFTPVAVGAHVLQNILYSNKNALTAGMILAGWDQEEGGQVFALPMGGTMLKVRNQLLLCTTTGQELLELNALCME
jgi:20S proteasome subunit beta 1